MLPPRKPKPKKRETRWRSPAHTRFVIDHACCHCGTMERTEAAHVRLGSHTALGRKPDDWRCVSLCRDCHALQHRVGEQTFWQGKDPEALIAAFCRASPKRAEIERVRREWTYSLNVPTP